MLIQEAKNIAANIIKNNAYHKDYDEQIKIAEQYKTYVTGKGIEATLIQFYRREDEAEFTQRKELSQITIPANIARVMQPIDRLKIVKPQTMEIRFAEDNDKSKSISKRINNYSNGTSLLDIVVDSVINYANIDPNAFLINSFIAVDDTHEMITTIVESKNVLNYSTNIRGEYEWIFCRFEDERQILTGDKYIKATIEEFIFYHADYDIVFTQAKTGTKVGSKFYNIQEYMHEGTGLSAYKLGVKASKTNSDLCVPFIYDGENIIIKMIQQISECDLTRRLHAFPRMYEYLPECQGDGANVCMRGYTAEGSICKSCNGTGHSTHKSTQDKVTLTMPTNPEKMFNLQMLQSYANMPVDSFKFMYDLVDKYSAELLQTIYNKNIFDSNSISKTATETLIDMQSVFDAITWFTKKISNIYAGSIADYARFVEVEAEVTVSYPYNINLIGYEGLLGVLNEAKTAGASSDSISKINEMIETSLYVDAPEEHLQIKTKRYFNPFKGKSIDEIQLQLGSPLVTDFDKCLYYNMDKIFLKIDLEQPNFYTSTTAKQFEIITTYVEAILEETKVEVELPEFDSTATE